jgi:purine-binding chemotaxis protein CheW
MDHNEGVLAPIQEHDGRPRADGPLRVCLISLSGEFFAIDLRNVREVFEVEGVTPVPGMPAVLAGVANLRGVVMPLVDLRRLLGLPVSGPTPRFAVVIRHESQQIAVLVDQVPEIRTVQNDELLPAPARSAQSSTPFVTAILRLEDRIGGMVEVPTLLAQVETGGV